MPFGPGAWAGVNDAFAISRQRDIDRQMAAQRDQQMRRSQWDLDVAQQDRARDLRARSGAGQSLYALAPPMPGGQQPSPPQPPMPGAPSAPGGPPPSGPPGGGQQPQFAPGIPQFGGPPPMAGGPQGMPPQGPQGPGGMPPIPPYRSMPQPGAQPPMQQPQQVQQMPPPPVGAGGTPGGQQPTLVMQLVAAAKRDGVPPEDLVDRFEALSPVLKAQASEELAALRGTQAEQNIAIKALMAAVAAKREDRGERTDARRGDQRDRALDLSAQRIKAAKDRVAASGNSGEQLSEEGLRVAVELTRAGQTIPGGWSKQGISRGNAILNALAKDEEGGAGSGSVAEGRSDAKANTAALTQNTKDLAAIRPYKVMLDKNANIAIDLGKKIKLANAQWANQPIQWLQKNASSNPDLREYLAQIQIVQTEAARVLNNPRLVGQLTDSARHEMQEIIKGTMPLADTERVIRRMMVDGDNRVKALEEENKTLKSGTRGGSSVSGGAKGAAAEGSKNAKGWVLHVDGKGNKAYVSPDGKQFEEVQ